MKDEHKTAVLPLHPLSFILHPYFFRPSTLGWRQIGFRLAKLPK
jgi:hypothetical protein